MNNLLSRDAIYYLNNKIRKYLYNNEPVKGIVVHEYISSATGKLKRYAELMFDKYTGLILSGNRRWKNLEPDKIYTLEELSLRSKIMGNTEKCCICGKELGYMEGTHVESKNHFIRDVCWNCYDAKMKNADSILVLQAKVEAIAESLSDIQRQQVESIARNIIAKQIFSDLE